MESQQISTRNLPALLRQIYDLPPSEVKQSRQFQAIVKANLKKETLLSSIPSTSRASRRPLYLLYVILTEIPGPWPALHLIRCHTRLSNLLPEESWTRKNGETARLVRALSKLVQSSYKSFADFICDEKRSALRSVDPSNFITHQGLRQYVTNLQLPVESSGGRKPVVSIALPNGPLMAATCVAVTTYYTAAPINPAAGAEQFRADVLQAKAKVILTSENDYHKLQLDASWVREEGIQVFIVEWNGGDDIVVRTTNGSPLPSSPAPEPNQPDDIALILFTSGTSGTKKVVPLTIHSLVAGIIFVMDSWGLTVDDICLNMMPLYHVGGLVRNIFAPIFSRSSTVCCTTFDPNMFWDVVESIQPTWYYASPSMHSVILAEAPARSTALKKSQIRLACNAAGGLLPSLACQLRDTFNCVVLPSYGMTECMPISTPPLDYKLDREGTSGISTGPGLTILDWSDEHVKDGTVGRICVRGEPTFHGYLKPDGSLDKSPFNRSGWFDTGDLGYMDKDGYLYITGRSKEVINRGGELISPFEVENAIMSASMSEDSCISGRVSQALAFAAHHDVLQEVVAVVLVTPKGKPRVDMKTLHLALKLSLQQVKWPVLITYMDDLPKKNNKVLRINLGKRLSLPEVTDDTPYLQRHWNAQCPPPDTALSEPIKAALCRVDLKLITQGMDKVKPAELQCHTRKSPIDDSAQIFIAPSSGKIDDPDKDLPFKLKKQLGESIHNYMIPEQIHVMMEPLPTDASGRINEQKLTAVFEELQGANLKKLGSSTEGKVTKAFADILGCPPDEVPKDVDFFSLGGDSLRAGRLISQIRNDFKVQLPIGVIFNKGTVSAIATHIDKMLVDNPADDTEEEVVGCTKTYSSTNPFLLILQLFPLAVFYPMRRGFQWTAFIVMLSYTQSWPSNDSVIGRLFNVALSISVSRLIIRIIAPIIGILAKWIIIGRHREGLYPMWGWYHTRWWLVQKIVSLCGKGFFNFNDTTKRAYLRIMGAKIGKNVKFGGASLGEWDLLDIRDNAILTRCICRPFAAEGNTSMYLGRIVIGENCSIGISSIIAPGTTLAPNTCIGLNSSTWETEDADEEFREMSPGRGPKPHWLPNLLITIPLHFIGGVLSMIPWAAGLVGMVLNQPLANRSPLREILDWFTAPERIGFHYLALVLRVSLSPYFIFGFALIVKWTMDLMFGKMQSGPTEKRRPMDIWRASVIKTLLPVSRLHEMTTMFGQHYEATSVALRMLGAKVGKRVYWPGTGPSISDYHLLEVGNDVVFGSRAHLISTDGYGSEKIKIKDRAMIADRVSLLPGVEVGDHTTMGSGALTRRGMTYPAGGTYVGSKGGDAVCLSSGSDMTEKTGRRIQHMSSEDTLTGDGNQNSQRIRHMSSADTLAETGNARVKRYQSSESGSDSDTEVGEEPPASDSVSPFGRAFYLNLASYRVMGQFTIFMYSTFITVFTAFYWNVPSISSIQAVNALMNQFVPRTINLWYNVAIVYGLTTVCIAILTTLQSLLAILIVIAAKWIIMGRRKPGNYDWDKSSYCQRWQLFLCVEKLRRHCYRGNGILGMLTGTRWIVWYFKALGATIGKDVSLFANGRPNLMFTEPDLITLGDRVVIDDASVVGHINTRGKFDLNRLEIGDRCVMRTGSRLLSGAQMKDDSCLLEHTLIMGGDVVENKWTMQGWPAERFRGERLKVTNVQKE